MSYIGRVLYEELRQTDLEVVCGIDTNIIDMDTIPMYKPDDKIPQFELLIVTSITYFEMIKSNMQSKIDCKIISFDE